MFLKYFIAQKMPCPIVLIDLLSYDKNTEIWNIGRIEALS